MRVQFTVRGYHAGNDTAQGGRPIYTVKTQGRQFLRQLQLTDRMPIQRFSADTPAFPRIHPVDIDAISMR